jgi:hypothetical protein
MLPAIAFRGYIYNYKLLRQYNTLGLLIGPEALLLREFRAG